ncbi:MAG TPA: CheR family methyltransferase, partial [Pyrinomonadaceae bacterium]
GGIQALKEFFTNVTKDSGMAYVVILHMSPEHESRLAEILQAGSAIPITQVKGPIKVEPNKVYVVPPNQNLAMSDGHLTLTHMIAVEERRSPVDLFFRTLAESNDSRAVSVILSGTGSNGSMGLKRIKEHGGVAFVQDPNEAQYSDMPRNAIATGLVDYVLPVHEIPGRILAYKERRGSISMPDVKEIPISDEQALREVFTQLRVRTGHDFSNYKRATLLRRIERRMGVKEISGLQEYAQFMRQNQHEPHALMKDLLISVTNFFRDPESVNALAQKILPALFFKKIDEDQVRVWIAGCATGEEAYTIAMLLNETMADSTSAPQVQIFATDLDAEAIASAREGFYTDAEVADISAERLQRFFVKEHDGYRVRRELRERVLFAVHNIIRDPPFSHLDLISCRNLLIYLNRPAQSRVLEVLHFALNPTSYLFLGASESIDGSIDFFSAIDKEHHIYQSRPVLSRLILPTPEIGFSTPVEFPTEKERTAVEARAMERLTYVDLHQRMLEEYAAPSVVVNEQYDVVHISDKAGHYMHVAGGEVTKNLLKLVRPEIRLELRTALYQAVQNRVQVRTEGLQVNTEEGRKQINLIIKPVLKNSDSARGLILVLFEETALVAHESVARTGLRPAEPLSQQLEDELLQSKSQLRATVEQYEIQQEELRASNEELQAMNEELRSAAEELETSKEELQSLNEELTTVNQELKIKIEELNQTNNDFANLINSTDIATIFLDRSKRVKLFTPRARDIFNLIASDTARPLLDITNTLAKDSILTDIEYVLTTLHKLERQVETNDGRWYMMRIHPYRTLQDHIDGVVITFSDVTESKVAKDAVDRVRSELDTTLNERTKELRESNESLSAEVAERRLSESARVKLLSQLVNAQENERRRVARDLHDQLGQQLTVLRLKLESLKTQAAKNKKVQGNVDELLTIISRLDSDVDFLAWELRPVLLDDLGLSEALRVYITQWSRHVKLPADFHTTGFENERLQPLVENHLYRITQEALNNVAKHSEASKVDILLERRDQHAVLIVEDNGRGFSAGEVNDGSETFGLTGIYERAALLGGSCEIESSPEKGTTIFIRVPTENTGGS